MSATEVQWIGSSCGRHGSYTFYKGFRINSHGEEKSYCLGEFYFVRNSNDKPICIAELQLVWHDASTDSKLASARLYFKPENTPFGRLSIHGEDELLYADQKVIIKCEDMVQWQYTGTDWTTGLIAPQESDFIVTPNTCIDEFTGNIEHKYKLQEKYLCIKQDTYVDKVIIMTFQAYCRYKALLQRLKEGLTISKSRLTALGGVLINTKATRIVFCRECFSCPDLEKFHLSGDNKAPVLKGRPRKKRIRSSTLAKELKRKRFLADLERVKNNLLTKKPKLSESEEGTESDLSEESTKSSESMDEAEQPRIKVESPIPKVKTINGLKPGTIKQVVMVISDKAKVPPPLIPTTKLKGVVTSPPPLQKVKVKSEIPSVTKRDTGPPPLCPITKRSEITMKVVPIVQSRLVSAPETAKNHLDGSSHLPTSKGYTLVRSVGNPASASTGAPKPEPIRAVEPLGSTDGKTMTEVRSVGGIVKMEGKENLQDSNKTKKKRLRQPGSMKEFNEDIADDDEKYFMRSLREFMKSRDTPISKIPALGFKRVNLWTMYKTAQKLGGYEMVTTKRLWRQVYDALGGSTTITSAATYTRRHYERLLLPYERFVRGQLNKKNAMPQTPKSSQSNVSKEQPNQPITSSSQPTNKISPTSRITINNIGSTHRKESRDNKDISNVTNSLSRDGLKSTVVKVKPNGAIPPYSVSIQSSKKDGVTPSTIIITKSVDVPVSSVQSLPTTMQRNPQYNSGAPVTSQTSQRRTSVTSGVTPDRTSVTLASSHAGTISNGIKSPVSKPRSLWEKDYVTSSVVTQKQIAVTPKQSVVTQKQTSVTQKQTSVTQKQHVVSQKQTSKEVVTPNQVTQGSGRGRQSPPAHKEGYNIYSEEPIRTRLRKASENENNQDHRSKTFPKYLTISETYDLIHSKAINNRKRSHEEDSDSRKTMSTEKETVLKHDSISKDIPAEPLPKRRKTPSPCHAIPQHHFVSHVEESRISGHAEVSRSVSNAEPVTRNVSNEESISRSAERHIDTNTSSHPPSTPPSSSVISTRNNQFGDNGRRHENKTYADRGKSDEHLKQQSGNSNVKDVVDLTDSDTSSSYSYRRATSPLYNNMTFPYNNQDHVTDSCQRTDPRHHGNTRHILVTQSKAAHDYRDEPTHKSLVKTAKEYFQADKQPEFDHYQAKNNERTLSQRTSVESPDAHFQEWRRRQGLTQYPAYITANEPPQRRRPSITEQLHPQTPPQEHRYIYVQDDNGMTPRVIEEVPLIISTKPGLYYPEESLYGVPFYHGGWPATADGAMAFKGDPETLRNNNHLRSTSCVFMPTTQMFGPAGPMAPISPPIINQGHVTTGPEAIRQHCLMTSPYPHNHVIVSQSPTRPLHSFT